MKTAIRLFCFSLAFGSGPVLGADSAAQYPNKTVCVIVPQAPGGGIDFMARLYAARLSDSLGQQFIVDNRTGAGATIGTSSVAKATPDGYTLLVSSISTAFNATLYKSLPFETVKDLTGVSLLAPRRTCSSSMPPRDRSRSPSSSRSRK